MLCEQDRPRWRWDGDDCSDARGCVLPPTLKNLIGGELNIERMPLIGVRWMK
jgi:hypothetical protein